MLNEKDEKDDEKDDKDGADFHRQPSIRRNALEDEGGSRADRAKTPRNANLKHLLELRAHAQHIGLGLLGVILDAASTDDNIKRRSQTTSARRTGQ